MLRLHRETLRVPSSIRHAVGWRYPRNYSQAAVQREIPKPFSAIPGPKPLPVLGNVWELRNNKDRLHLYYDECLKQYGGIFKLYVGGRGMVVISDPSAAETLFRADGKYPSRGVMEPYVQWMCKQIRLPTTMVFESDKQWKKLRTAIGKQILPQNVNSYAPWMNETAQQFISYIKAHRNAEGYVEDITPHFNKLMLEVSAKLLYGSELKVLEEPTEEAEMFINGVQVLIKSIGGITFSLPLYKLFPTKLYREFTGAVKDVYSIGNKYARQLTEKRQSNAIEGEEGARGPVPLLEQWATEGKLSRDEAIMQSIDLLFAGVDTTANSAVYLLYELPRNPDVQEKLYSEILSVVGEPRPLVVDDLPKLPYLKGCVREIGRYHPVTGLIPRDTNDEISLMGFRIPPKTTVIYSNYTAGRDERYFIEPEKFDPNRWNRDNIHPFASLPFGFGARGCYGRRFAELELKLITAQMVQNFILSTDQKELPTCFEITLVPAGKVPLQLNDRIQLNTSS